MYALQYLLFCSHLITIEMYEAGQEMDLISRLFENYYKPGRPIYNASKPIIVHLDLSLVKIVDVDMKNELLITNVQLMQQWTDEFLRWDPREYDGIARLSVPHEKMWTPDIILANDLEAPVEPTILPNVAVAFNGHANWAPRVQYTSNCHMDVTYFPFDIQQCFLSFYSWSYSGSKLRVEPARLGEKIHFMDESAATAFYVTDSTSCKFERLEYLPSEQNMTSTYIELVYGIELKRKALYHSYTSILPALIISIMTLIIFRLDPCSGNKIDVGVCILLVFHLMLRSTGEKLPENSTGIPLLGFYLAFVMTLTSLSVAISIGVINLYKTRDNREVPEWLCFVFFEKLSPFMGMSQRKKKRGKHSINNLAASSNTSSVICLLSQESLINHNLIRTIKNATMKKKEERNVSQWKRLAKVIDRLFFWIYLVVTAVVVLYFLVVMPNAQFKNSLVQSLINNFDFPDQLENV